MQKGALYFAGFLVGFVLIKDGTAGQLLTNLATAGGTFAKGLKPLSNVA